MADSVSMAEYVAGARARLREYLAALTPGELAYFEQAIAGLRHQGAADGVEEWNEDHLVGFLFATTMMGIGITNAHETGAISHDVMEHIAAVVEFNERYLVALVPDPRSN